MKKITVLMTCHNRKEHTAECILSLLKQKEMQLRFIVVDAGSTDGTAELLQEMKNAGAKIRVIHESDRLFWNGGMRVAMRVLTNYICRGLSCDGVLLVNDDVTFYQHSIRSLAERLEHTGADAVVGATCDGEGEMTYGGVRMLSTHFARFAPILPSEEPVCCDTCNCNCLLMTCECFLKIVELDPVYVHSMGDYDLGMRIRKMGMRLVNTANYIGFCEENGVKGSWRDKELPRSERIRKKESPKGLPARDWFHFVQKNYGTAAAVYHTVTPYLRILLGI